MNIKRRKVWQGNFSNITSPFIWRNNIHFPSSISTYAKRGQRFDLRDSWSSYRTASTESRLTPPLSQSTLFENRLESASLRGIRQLLSPAASSSFQKFPYSLEVWNPDWTKNLSPICSSLGYSLLPPWHNMHCWKTCRLEYHTISGYARGNIIADRLTHCLIAKLISYICFMQPSQLLKYCS